MRTTTSEKLTQLQKDPSCIRNICILAHVDHGKTTLADTLVASNGIISHRMAGKLRYLDSRADEQIRGITMKSSAISLRFEKSNKEYLINLIDSPGHIDFSSEVSTAVRLCDGAVVVVDVVEGVSPQTHAVLRQAWLEGIRPVLVLNKIDRLITELRLTPLEAHLHLQQQLEQVNAITGELFTAHVMEKTAMKSTAASNGDAPPAVGAETLYDWSSGVEDTDDSDLYFSPDQGNVIFASAIDGWGFGIRHFAAQYAAKLGFSEVALNKTLWGDFYFDSKTKRIRKGAQAKVKKPLFVQFILENLWAVYDAISISKDKERTEKIVKSLNLTIPARDMRHNDSRVLLQSVTSQWLPLAGALLAAVVEKLPSPCEVSEERVEKLLCSTTHSLDSFPAATQQLKHDFSACSSGSEAPVIVYVSKMFSVDRNQMPQNKPKALTVEEMAARREAALRRHAEKKAGIDTGQSAKDEDISNGTGKLEDGQAYIPLPEPVQEPDQQFVAFARVFSGVMRHNQTIYVLGPKHNPEVALQCAASDLSLSHVQRVTVGDLYMFMGRELEAMEEVPAGNILGVGGLGNHVLKSATLSTTLACPAFTDMHMEVVPIVKVAVEPQNPGDMRAVTEGLRLLNQADPCVETHIQETGEHIIVAAGEVHLQKCLDDLRDRYAKVEINVSPAIVAFRETIVPAPTMDNMNEEIEEQNMQVLPQQQPQKQVTSGGRDEVLEVGLVQLQTADTLCTVRVRALSLPIAVTNLLELHGPLIRLLDRYGNNDNESGSSRTGEGTLLADATAQTLSELRTKLQDAFIAAGEPWTEASVDKIWSFGPRRNGPNLLLNCVPGYERPNVWACLGGQAVGKRTWDFDTSVVNGFQMATLCGPLCEEPMWGVCFCVELWDMDRKLISRRERTLSEMSQGSDTASPTEELAALSLQPLDIITESVDPQLIDSAPTDQDSAPTDQNSAPTDQDSALTDQNSAPTDQNSAPTDQDSVPTDQDSAPTDQDSAPTPTPDHENVTASEPPSPLCVPQRRRGEQLAYGPFTGQLMSCVKDCCRRAFQSQPQRLMWAIYTCIIQANTDVLGKLYAVVGRRSGRVLQEDMREGSSLFTIEAALPVAESFGFAEEMRKRTSGLASPQLRFSHWEVIDRDPFWVPCTEEEYLHFGEKADSDNIALKHMNNVRRRKGLHVDEKIVEFGNKQRTLSKKV